MAKYKVGDRVRIVSTPPLVRWNDDMNTWLGKTMTIASVGSNSSEGIFYRMVEDCWSFYGVGWYWYEDMIAGLAEPEQKPYAVELRFDGAITTATLKRGGRDVKTAEARCNPKDTYSRAEGARIAVERLFKKKPSSSNNASKVRSVDDIASGIATGVREASKPKIGDKFVVIKHGRSGHYFDIGDVVTLIKPSQDGVFEFVGRTGLLKSLYCDEVYPLEGHAK